MERISAGEMERTMKVQEVILRTMAKKITWWQAAEILGVSERTMRRWKFGYQKHSYRALFDAQLVDDESTRSVMTALRHVTEHKGTFCTLYSDRAGHFFFTPKTGQPRTSPRNTVTSGVDAASYLRGE